MDGGGDNVGDFFPGAVNKSVCVNNRFYMSELRGENR